MTHRLPVALLCLRIALIPIFVAVYYLPEMVVGVAVKNWIGMLSFALGAAADWFTGYVARRAGMVSTFDVFLYPVVDKTRVVVALALIVWLGRADLFLASVVIGREIAIAGLRDRAAKIGMTKRGRVTGVWQKIVVIVFWLCGPVVTASVIALLLYEPVIPGISTPFLGVVTLWFAVLLIAISVPVSWIRVMRHMRT